MGSSEQPGSTPDETAEASNDTNPTETPSHDQRVHLPVSRRDALAAILGLGGLTVVSDSAQAEHGGSHWRRDHDAGGNTLFDLGALVMRDSETEITGFVGDGLSTDDDGVLDATNARPDVSGDGTDTVENIATLDFGANLVVNDPDPTDRSVTVAADQWDSDVDAGGADLTNLGSIKTTTSGRKIADFTGENLSIDGSNVLNARDTRTNVSDNGTEKVQNVEHINFGPKIGVTDDGNRSVTVDVTGVSRWADSDVDGLLEASGFDGIDVDKVSAEFVETRKFGTTDATAIVFVVDDLSFMRVFPTPPGEASNILAGHTNNGAAPGVVGATISGGGSTNQSNEVFDNYGTVSGGRLNRAGSDDGDSSSAEAATVSGGVDNQAKGDHSTVGGGLENVVSGDAATVGGGSGNDDVTGTAATVAGGSQNEASDDRATVGGGSNNRAIAPNTTIAGGFDNGALADEATVAGGFKNEATLTASTVGGGTNNKATAHAATVPGGEGNTAEGEYAVAAGRNATASAGSFVWGDGTPEEANGFKNTFTVQASGGVELFSTSDQSTGVTLLPGDSNWSSLSTRTAKSNIDPVDPRSVLDGVVGLEISTWEYNTNAGVDHMGPMAEDFHDAFGLGSDEERIGTVDADGVALAAIQGLALELDDRDKRIDELETKLEAKNDRVDHVEAENERLCERLDVLEDRVASIEAGPSSAVTGDD